MYVSTHECKCQWLSELLAPLELELQVVVRHSVWVIETELGSSIRAASTVNCSVSLGPKRYFLYDTFFALFFETIIFY